MNEGHLPPLTDKERAEVTAEFDKWFEANRQQFMDRTCAEQAWQWAFYTYKKQQ